MSDDKCLCRCDSRPSGTAQAVHEPQSNQRSKKGSRMSTIRILIDGTEVFAKPGQTILETCRENGLHIPTLCHDDQLRPLGSCQICAVDLQGHGLVTACATRVADGMVLQTHNAEVISARKQCLETLLADHYMATASRPVRPPARPVLTFKATLN